jgi:hypothetical protein
MPLTPRDRRTLIIGGGILAVLLIAFFLFNNVSGGGDDAIPQLPPITAAPGTGGGPSASVAPTTGAPTQPVFNGRDPFSIPPQLSPGSGSATSPTSPTSPGSTTTSPTSPTSPGSTTTPPSTPGGGSSTVKGGKTVVLLDTFQQGGEPMVQVEVDGTVYNVGIGERFGGGSFELRSVSGDCATFLFGDEPFTLCANSTK